MELLMQQYLHAGNHGVKTLSPAVWACYANETEQPEPADTDEQEQ